MIQELLQFIQKEMGRRYNENSIHYERYLAHLKFLARRVCDHNLLPAAFILCRIFLFDPGRNILQSMNAAGKLQTILRCSIMRTSQKKRSCIWQSISSVYLWKIKRIGGSG